MTWCLFAHWSLWLVRARRWPGPRADVPVPGATGKHQWRSEKFCFISILLFARPRRQSVHASRPMDGCVRAQRRPAWCACARLAPPSPSLLEMVREREREMYKYVWCDIWPKNRPFRLGVHTHKARFYPNIDHLCGGTTCERAQHGRQTGRQAGRQAGGLIRARLKTTRADGLEA